MALFSRDPVTQFPEVTGTALDGTKRALPADFSAPHNLLIFTFDDEYDPLSDQWAAAAERIARAAPGQLAVYELPLVGKGFKVFKGLIRRTMKAGTDAKGEAERTVPLYVDKKDFAKSLGLKNKKTVHLLLVDPDGHIRWREQGSLTPPKVAAIEEIVGETLSVAPADSAPPKQPDERAD